MTAGAAAGAVTESDSHAPDPMEGDGGDPNDKGVEEAKRDAELLSPSSDRPQTPEPRQEEQEQAMENSSLAEVDIYRVEVPSTAGSIRGSEPDHDALAEVSEQEEKDQEEPEQRESKANAGEGRAGKDESASLVTGTEEKGSEVVPDGNGSSSASSSTSVRSVKSVKGAHPLVNGNNNTASNHHPHHHLRKLSSSISLGGSNSGKKGQPSGSSKNRAESGKGTTTRKSSSASIHKESMHS